tara:strand:- start:6444 stop:7754 length:1311 start_codon:yes stop_codon:yes gene_type:complete
MKSKIFKARFQIFANILLFFFYFIIATNTPYAADDFRYKLNPFENQLSILILEDVLNFQVWHYFNWSGRIVPNFLLQLFLLPSKFIFNFFNAVVQVLLINTIFYFAYNRIATKYREVSLLLLINLFLFFGFYKYSGLSIYLTSTISYTWTHLIVLIYYLPFWNFIVNGKNYSGSYSFTLLGLIVGCTNEHVFIAQLFFFISLFILNKKSVIKELPSFFYPSFFGVFSGGLILLLSPGNFVRASSTNVILSIDSIIKYLIYDLTWVTHDIKPFWFMVILLIIVNHFLNKRSLLVSMPHILILSLGIISSVSMALSPSYHSGTNLFLFISIIIFVLSSINISTFSHYLSYLNIILTLLLFMYLYQSHNFINDYFFDTEQEILSEKNKGNYNLIIKNINIETNRLVHYYAIENNPNRPRNIHISKYYGIKSIRSVNQNN